MSSNAQTDGGGENSFEPTVVETEAELAETIRQPYARDADMVQAILEATDAVAIKLQSSWWGNETFGIWSEWFLIHPDNVSPSGKALFVDDGIALNDALGKLRSYHRIMNDDHTGYTSQAARRFKRKAFNWDDNSQLPGPGTLPTDERDSFSDESAPLSVIEVAVRLPEPQDDLVFPVNGATRRGKLSEGDIRFTGFKQTRYGPKAVLKGDTYNALSQERDNACDDVWDEAHVGFDGDDWTCDVEGDAILTAIRALHDHGYSVAVAEEFEGNIEEAQDVAASFGLDL